ncbi:MAG: hypothetical protein RLY43_742 [Bacteroidota bacterium]|jgi:asparagine synthase (glutamine-hydrolysing)
MCGIVGSVNKELNRVQKEHLLKSISHRGPDGFGEVEMDQIWLAHTRLSILDLSNAGKQPMHSKCGNYTISFNGEIYNHKKLRELLLYEGLKFNGTSDTEILIEYISKFGINRALQDIEGMYAFAIWDARIKKLYLVRDKIGEKPIYYINSTENFIFCSEIQGLYNFIDINCINHQAVQEYFKYICIGDDRTVNSQIKKLEPGSILTIQNKELKIEKYWNVLTKSDLIHNSRISLDSALKEFEKLIFKSVEERMCADVNVGSFLSGGIDSTLISFVQTKLSNQRVKTFTVGYKQSKNDETVYANEIASYLNTEHHQKTFDVDEFLNEIDRLMLISGEPFADASTIPTYILSKYAKKHVKVVLTGDGADEIFGGYPRYIWSNKIKKIKKFANSRALNFLSSVISRTSPEKLNILDQYIFSNKLGGPNGLHYRISRLIDYIKIDEKEVFEKLISVWKSSDEVYKKGPEFYKKLVHRDSLEGADLLMLNDQLGYLPNDILVKADRVTMAAGLESRAPFLDSEIINWSWEIPKRMKYETNDDLGKIILREYLYKNVPRKLLDRPKMGFGSPLDTWLKGPLKSWVETIIEPKNMIAIDVNYEAVLKNWKSFLMGENNINKIWSVLNWYYWNRRYRPHLFSDKQMIFHA